MLIILILVMLISQLVIIIEMNKYKCKEGMRKFSFCIYSQYFIFLTKLYIKQPCKVFHFKALSFAHLKILFFFNF